MRNDKLIITPSGIRGVFGKGLNLAVVKKYSLAFGQWIKKYGNFVIVGRDTRNSGKAIESEVISALTSTGCQVLNAGECPTPVIVHTKNTLGIPGGVIISGSHNPEQYNALKFMSKQTFLSYEELEEISKLIETGKIDKISEKGPIDVQEINPLEEYLENLLKFIDFDAIKANNRLKVIVDTGAGTAKLIVPRLLEILGCKVKVINNEKIKKGKFPRNPEPVELNLQKLKQVIIKEKYDIGFAYDCDADRLSIVGENGKWYQEDIGLALIAEYTFRELAAQNIKGLFVTNNASSLMFDAIVSKFDGSIIRTPIGERHLAERMLFILKRKQDSQEKSKTYVFGGEGSCGGVMFPTFNNARDGIFATAKIIEIMVKSGEKISNLIEKLPKFYSKRAIVSIHGIELEKLQDILKEHFLSKGNVISVLDQDIKIAKANDWFVLIHPSNTEPIVRIISEARSENLAENLVLEISQIVQNLSTAQLN